jgi:hypothetical protein
MAISWKISLIIAPFALAACTTVPTGPAVMVLPGTGMSFDQFRIDDGACRQFAFDQIGGQTAARSQEESAMKSAVVGTAVGAIAGAAIGGNSSGAATGAGVGLLGGSMAGAGAAGQSAHDAQYRYDVAYQQCMYAKGHRIPDSGRFTYSEPERAPAVNYPSPPPPGSPPPPPR